MTAALDRVFGHFVLVLALEVAFIVLLLQNGVAFYDHSWAVLVAFALGGLGAPLTLLVPYLLTHDNAFAPVVLLIAAPLVNLLLRFAGIYLKVDQAKVPVDPIEDVTGS